jgi:hypothetical protein
MRIGPFEVECQTRQRVHKRRGRVAAERDLFECRGSTLAHCVQQRAISRWVDLADCVMRQALRVIPDEIRISLFVAVGDLPWDRNPRFCQRGVHAILVGIQGSLYARSAERHQEYNDERCFSGRAKSGVTLRPGYLSYYFVFAIAHLVSKSVL